jgi:hypothetical protein
VSCPPGTTCKSWGFQEVRGSAIRRTSGRRPLVLFLRQPGSTSGMPTEPQQVTLAEVVHRAVEVCEDSSSEGLDELLERFEDADEPITAVEDIERRLNETLGPPDADESDASLTMARAVIAYLAHRRDELNQDPVELLVLASRAEFGAHPPEHVARWLELQGIAI